MYELIKVGKETIGNEEANAIDKGLFGFKIETPQPKFTVSVTYYW